MYEPVEVFGLKGDGKSGRSVFHSPISRVRAVFRMISITGFLPEGQSLIFAVLAFESDEAAFCRTSFVFRCCSAGPLNWGRVPSGGRRPDLSFAGVWKENQGNIGRKVVLRFKRKGVRIVRGGSVDFCFMEGNHFFLPDPRDEVCKSESGGFAGAIPQGDSIFWM